MRHRQSFYHREQHILDAAEQILLDSGVAEVVLDDLAQSLGIAKGTLYKHFKSKDELYLRLLIRYERQLLAINSINDSAMASLARLMLQALLEPQRAMTFFALEERLSTQAVGMKQLFDELYEVRHQRMKIVFAQTKAYLHSQGSSIDAKHYLASVWAMAQGGANLLNSSFYQRVLGRRDVLIVGFLVQALTLAMTHQTAPIKPLSKPTPTTTNEEKIKDDFSPFGKLAPPSL
ncbi:MAG: TetR/AcrR family transcriptional regulator [Moraxella sp.]|nr:TetR/AcrR family transcriptional regulator [Moraxella sp.]